MSDFCLNILGLFGRLCVYFALVALPVAFFAGWLVCGWAILLLVLFDASWNALAFFVVLEIEMLAFVGAGFCVVRYCDDLKEQLKETNLGPQASTNFQRLENPSAGASQNMHVAGIWALRALLITALIVGYGFAVFYTFKLLENLFYGQTHENLGLKVFLWVVQGSTLNFAFAGLYYLLFCSKDVRSTPFWTLWNLAKSPPPPIQPQPTLTPTTTPL